MTIGDDGTDSRVYDKFIFVRSFDKILFAKGHAFLTRDSRAATSGEMRQVHKGDRE